MFGLLPGQTPRALLGGDCAGSWDVRYYREFDMTNDRSLWTKPNGQLWTPLDVCGMDWPNDVTISFAKIRTAMVARGFWPLYEGKHIDQWLIDTKPVVRWLSLEACQAANGKLPATSPKLVFRDIARNTDERTCIASVLSERSCSCNTLATLGVEHLPLDVASCVMNSLAFDYLTRLKTAGTHLNWTYISRVPVPAVESLHPLTPIPTRSAIGTTRWKGRTAKDRIALSNSPDHFEELWRNEHAVARAYELDADDFAHRMLG